MIKIWGRFLCCITTNKSKNSCELVEVHWESSQSSKMKLLTKIVNSSITDVHEKFTNQPLSGFAKSSFLDVQLGFEYNSEILVVDFKRMPTQSFR